MSQESSYREVGSFFEDATKDFRVFTWKISNVSSIEHKVDYVVQSPSFSLGGESWIFKMYPYGQTMYETQGYIDLEIVRLRRQAKTHRFTVKIFCENVLSKEAHTKTGIFVFESQCAEAKIHRFMQNLKECPEKWQYAPNDVFTLVFGFDGHTIKKELDVQSKSDEKDAGKRRKGKQEIGEIFKDSLNLRSLYWKICSFASHQLPEDYQVQSPSFSLGRALWVFKMYPYFRMQQSSKPSFDVVLERLHSEIPEHYVVLKILLAHPAENEKQEVNGCLFFNSHHTYGDIINYQLKEEIIRGMNCMDLKIEINMKGYAGAEKTSLTKLAETPLVAGNVSGSSSVIQNSKVLKDYKELFQQQEDCDVIIKVQGQEFRAHRIILKARSPVFASTFRIDMKEKATGVVDVEDCDPSTFSDFLSFLYCGELEKFSEDNVFSLFTAADKYDVPDLRSMCMGFMKNNLTIDTFCDTIALALQHSEADLIELSTDFFAKNLQEIIVTVKWQSFVVENPIQGNELMIKALVPSRK